jgi:peptidylprolyl isomerase
MQNKKMMVVWFIIVIVVVLGLIYITIKSKNPVAEDLPTGQEENTNMDNTQAQGQGVIITILKEGTGAVAKVGDSVSMNYTGTFADGTAFDSNIDPKFQHVEPFVFTIGAGQVIKGWDVGIAGMKVGEKRKLELAPEFAYGEAGAGGVIPPNATLIFEVELLGINK